MVGNGPKYILFAFIFSFKVKWNIETNQNLIIWEVEIEQCLTLLMINYYNRCYKYKVLISWYTDNIEDSTFLKMLFYLQFYALLLT